jgi:hypothetical protein
MPCTISKLRRRRRIALTQAERKFDTSGEKSPYSEDPRNSCVGTHGLAAPFIRLRRRNRALQREAARCIYSWWHKALS